MDISFRWSQQSNLDQQKSIEGEIAAIIKNRNISPCHPGSISVSLGISGPLDDKFQGSAECQCGKKLMEFSGSPYSLKINFREYK